MNIPSQQRLPSARSRGLSWFTSPQAVHLIGSVLYAVSGRGKAKNIGGLADIKEVLIVRLDAVGDVTLTTPLLREFRRNLPNARVTLVVNPEVYPIIKGCPYVDEILTYDWRISGAFCRLRKHLRALRLAVVHLWKRRFDLAVLPRWDVDYENGSFLAYFSGARRRIGYSEHVKTDKAVLNHGYDLLFTDLIPVSELKHEVERTLEVIPFLGGTVGSSHLEVWPDEDDGVLLRDVLPVGEKSGLWIGIGMGSKAPKRAWPVEKYSQVIQWLLASQDSRVVLLGGRSEAGLAQDVLGRLVPDMAQRVSNAVGRTTPGQVIGILKKCDLYVGNDTGLVHLASAVKTPVVVISSWPRNGNTFSANSPCRFGPWQVEHVFVCPDEPLSPCSGWCSSPETHCISQVKVEDVKAAISKLLPGGVASGHGGVRGSMTNG